MIRPTIIIQISANYLKVALARPQSGRLRTYDGVAERIQSLSDDLITERLVAFLKKSKVKPSSVVLSLPRNIATVRNLHLPSQDKREIAQMVELNIVRMVPYKKEDIVSAYRVLGLDERDFTKVIIALVKIDILRRFVGIVESAGLNIDRITLGSYGVWSRLSSPGVQKLKSGALCLALDVDTEFTDCIIFSSDELLFSRCINMGAQSIIENLDTGVNRFLGEVKQSLVTFYNEETNQKPMKIFLSGAKVKEMLLENIAAELDAAVELSDNPAQIPEDASWAGMMELSEKGAGEVGFTLPEIQIRRSLRQSVRDLVALGGLCVYIFMVLFVLFGGRISNRENYGNRVRERAALIGKELGNLPEKLRKMEFVKERLRERRAPLFVITQVQRIIPEAVAMSAVSIDDQGRVSIRGQANDMADVFKFIDELGKIKNFSDVQTKSTKKKKVQDRDLTDFEISLSLR